MALSARVDVNVMSILGRSASVVQHITWKGRDYAAKVSPADSDACALREFIALDRLAGHVCIPQVMCIERCDTTECITILEFLAGHDLQKLLDDSPGLQHEAQLDATMARLIATQLLSAAAHAHSRGVAHRDISLDNVIFDAERKRAVLIDWNMAVTDSEECKRPTYGVTVSKHGYTMGFGEYAEGARTSSLGAPWVEACRQASAMPAESLHADPVDLYGKYEYRAPLGSEGNWLQQDAYACGVILAKLAQAVPSFRCPVVQTVTAGLLARPDARMSLAQAATAFTAA